MWVRLRSRVMVRVRVRDPYLDKGIVTMQLFLGYRAKATDRLLFFVANQNYAIEHLYDDGIG